MGFECNKVKLYTTQAPIVLETINKKGVSYVKKKFIKMKYKECAHLFLQCYDWFVNKAQNIVHKPQDAEYAIWAFTEAKYSGLYKNTYLITLEVPIEEVIFFRMEDWNKILNFRYLPNDEEDEIKHKNKLQLYNISDETDIFLKPFYPQLKLEVKKSWNNLFRFDESIKQNGLSQTPFQASLWQIKKEWIISTQGDGSSVSLH